MLKDMLQATVIAAVDVVLVDKPDQLKDDVTQQMLGNILVGEQIEGVAEKLIKLVEQLAIQYEKIPRAKTVVANYLFEYLDLPRKNIDKDITIALVNSANVAIASDTVVVLDIDLKLNTLPNQSITVNREDNHDDTSPVTDTVVLLKTSLHKAYLFVLGQDINMFSMVQAGNQTLIEILPNFTIDEFTKQLESLIDTEFAPKVMTDREILTIDGLDIKWVQDHLSQPGLVVDEQHYTSANAFVDYMVNTYVNGNKLDASDKRIELTHLDALLSFAANAVENHDKPTDTGQTETVTPELAAPVDEDSSLFNNGVTEQTEETVAPGFESLDLFSDDIEDAIIIEDEVPLSDSVTTAVDILCKLGDEPAKTLALIDGSQLTIKDTLYGVVFDTLPSVEKRTHASYGDVEKEEIRTALNEHMRQVLSTLNDYKQKIIEEHKLSLPFNTELVNDVIEASPVHNSFMKNEEERLLLADTIATYLNSNADELEYSEQERSKRVKSILRKLSLFDYDTESLINPTFSALNVPPAEKLIRNTKVIARTLIKTYLSTNVWSGAQAELMQHTYAEMFNGVLSGLDISKEVYDVLVNSGLPKKSFIKTGEYITINVPTSDVSTSVSIIILSASEARYLNIDTTEQIVVSAGAVTKPEQRLEILNLILD